MCGIVAVLPAPPPENGFDLVPFVRTLENLHVPPLNAWRDDVSGIKRTRDALDTAYRVLMEPKSEYRLLTDQPLAARVRSALTRLGHELDSIERRLREPTATAQRELIKLRSALWDLSHGCMSRIDAVADMLHNIGLSPRVVPASAATGYGAIETALRSLDRIERVTPRSTGLHVWIHGTSLSDSREPAEGTLGRASRAGDGLAFSYTLANDNVRPGDNVAALREVVTNDEMLAKALSSLDAQVSVLAGTHIPKCRAPRDFAHGSQGQPTRHTAAVAQIGSCPTVDAAEPVDERSSVECRGTCGRTRRPLLGSDTSISRLAKALASARYPRAVIALSYQQADPLMLGVQGAGMSLSIGLTPMGWVVASEPHGVTGETRRYLRVTPPVAADRAISGSILTLSREAAGDLTGLRRYHLDQTRHPVHPYEIETTVGH